MTSTRALTLAAALVAFAALALVAVPRAAHATPPPFALVVAGAPGGAPVARAVAPRQAPTATTPATATLAPTVTVTPLAVTATPRPGFTLTIEAAIRTATAARFAASGTLAAATMTALARGTAVLTNTATTTATATITFTPGVTTTATTTPTLPPVWGVDALCRCHVPPYPPGSPECEQLKAEYVRDVLRAWASQTALARGTDTPTPLPSETPVPTATPSVTPRSTDEPTPSPAPTWTPHVIVVTATPAPRHRALLPMVIARRPRR